VIEGPTATILNPRAANRCAILCPAAGSEVASSTWTVIPCVINGGFECAGLGDDIAEGD
jgi:hypothetical protein